MRPIFVSVALLLPLSAAAKEVRPVSCRFLALGGSGASSSLIAMSDKGAKVSCPLNADFLSGPVVCFATDHKISFFSPADGKPAATAAIPPAAQSAVLVCVAGPGAEASSWRVLAIDDSYKKFPDGGAYITNFYNQDIRFIVGEHRGMLHPAGNHGYAMPAERDSFNMASVVFEFQQDQEWRTASESALRFVKGLRYLIFAYTDPASGRPRISTFKDLSQPASPVP